MFTVIIILLCNNYNYYINLCMFIYVVSVFDEGGWEGGEERGECNGKK